MKYTLLAATFLINVASYSQNTLFFNDSETAFRNGLELLDKSHYAAARNEFENYIANGKEESLKTTAQYYLAYCALGLYHQDGEKRIENFLA